MVEVHEDEQARAGIHREREFPALDTQGKHRDQLVQTLVDATDCGVL